MSKRTPSEASPAVDPVFALAAAESSRRRDYEARCAQFQRELDRLAKPLNEAGTFIGDCSDEQFARDWAITLMSAGQAITEAGLCELVEDREEWMPARLARAALRAANRERAEVETATHCIVNDPTQREGVRSSLREIANEFARRLRERHDATLRDEFPTLAPNAVPVAAPPTPPAGTEKSEGEKSLPAPKAGRRVGRPKLSASNNPETQAKVNLYKLVRGTKQANPSWGKKELHNHFKANRDFQLRVKDAGATFGVQFFHAALEWIKTNPSGQETTSGQETRSGNVS